MDIKHKIIEGSEMEHTIISREEAMPPNAEAVSMADSVRKKRASAKRYMISIISAIEEKLYLYDSEGIKNAASEKAATIT